MKSINNKLLPELRKLGISCPGITQASECERDVWVIGLDFHISETFTLLYERFGKNRYTIISDGFYYDRKILQLRLKGRDLISRFEPHQEHYMGTHEFARRLKRL